MLFLLINILINISDAQPDPIIHIPIAINCNSQTTDTTTQENNKAYYQFDLSQSSYIEINTCGSDFNTHLTLMDENNNTIASNDDGLDDECGSMNAIIKTGRLPAGSYTIQVTSIFSGFGSYHLALQCDPYGPPTMPDLQGIPVESDCNFFQDRLAIIPMDVCTTSESLDLNFDYSFNSRKYICIPEEFENGVLMVSYENPDCSGTGITSRIPGGVGNPYYYNCAGSSDNCDLGTLSHICIVPDLGEVVGWKETYALGVCVDGGMFKCDDGILTFNEYDEDNCGGGVEVIEVPDGTDGDCRFETDCSCDLDRLNQECESGLDCPDCMQCCSKRKVCEFPRQRAESVLKSINEMDELHGIEGVETSVYEGYKDIILIGVILFVLINNLFICYWCVCKRGNDSQVKFEKCNVVIDDE